MTRARPEEALHRAVAEFLTLALPEDAWFCHVPNGGKRSKSEAARFKAMGVKAGVPDLLIIYQGRAHWVELKAGKGRLSEAQQTVRAQLYAVDCHWADCRSLDDVEWWIGQWGIPLRASVRAA